MVFIRGGRILIRPGFSFGQAGGLGFGAPAPGARLSSGARVSLCIGFPAGGSSPERAVSCPGKPKGRRSALSIASAHGGQDVRGWHSPCYFTVYESTDSVDNAIVFRPARAHLHCLPGQVGGDSTPKRSHTHQIETARE